MAQKKKNKKQEILSAKDLLAWLAGEKTLSISIYGLYQLANQGLEELNEKKQWGLKEKKAYEELVRIKKMAKKMIDINEEVKRWEIEGNPWEKKEVKNEEN